MMYFKRILCLVFFVMMALPLSAQTDSYKYHQVFMYIFARFIEWPEQVSEGDFVIGVLGESPVEESLREMARTKRLDGRRIVVKRIESLGEGRECHIAYVSSGQSHRLFLLKEKVKGLPVLLVTEKPGYATKGSAINLIRKNGRLRFELNKEVLRQSSLRPMPNLLKFAILV
ncbi:hypothetical protein FUAX_36440 [Fulvitalea axinellae]|uniref:YfiR family protein n=1 Tax=Fulvitalea axinellae TaxID=1182444 RepID=A0AAU9D0L3_9BACT|nr:hypothetical protein FUAX_36440 [Fulvitalea axinellae]